ncbi:lipid phosphate phosphatase 1 [Schizopora paradoxa]|uniref:Lipid phosphate phosphatase 1 n=1 Tax=Schizopora paradoxa TaxID=27342 RepID=A0A0H2RDF1_9AGAM|nr:lipid phosphate phosphatase 1 [Schizopora paradoxa]
MNTLFGSQLSNLEWFNVAYFGDWTVVTGIWFLASYIDGLPPFEREFSLDDPLINHPHTKQQIGGSTNNLMSFIVPLVLIVISSALFSSLFAIHNNALGLWTARASSRLITEFLKNRVGRLRPDFLARCAWDDVTLQCTGKAADILDGRRSFPSGHSSTAFAGMTFLFLWISAQTMTWNLSYPLQRLNFPLLNCRSARVILCLAPLSYATWVAVSRVEDYRHHKEDVIVGSILGFFCGAVSYLMYWPNPLSSKNIEDRIVKEPIFVYGQRSAVTQSSDYELANVEDGPMHV